jgi:uncharacterized protein (TIGR02186 family)
VAVRGIKFLGLACLGLLAAMVAIPAAGEIQSDTLHVKPSRVDIGAFFQGAEITLKGALPPGAAAVVEIQGTTIQQKLLRKGRRWGLWMTVGEIEVDHAPNLYLVLSSTPAIPELNDGQTPWGLATLKSQIHFRGTLEEREKDRFFKEFLELKMSEGLYAFLPGAIKVSPVSGEGRVFTGNFRLPAKTPPGDYQVRLSLIKDSRLANRQTARLEVRMVGFPSLFASLAYEYAALYGLLAVVIAIATGFIMGFLFKGKAEH